MSREGDGLGVWRVGAPPPQHHFAGKRDLTLLSNLMLGNHPRMFLILGEQRLRCHQCDLGAARCDAVQHQCAHHSTLGIPALPKLPEHALRAQIPSFAMGLDLMYQSTLGNGLQRHQELISNGPHAGQEPLPLEYHDSKSP